MISLSKKYPYSEIFWSAFFFIRNEYGDLLCKSPYSVRMRENIKKNPPNTDTFQAVFMMQLIAKFK